MHFFILAVFYVKSLLKNQNSGTLVLFISTSILCISFVFCYCRQNLFHIFAYVIIFFSSTLLQLTLCDCEELCQISGYCIHKCNMSQLNKHPLSEYACVKFILSKYCVKFLHLLTPSEIEKS